MAAFHFIFKTFNPQNSAYFIGLHGSDDAWFGTDAAIDGYKGMSKKMRVMASQTGWGAFKVMALFRGTREECQTHIKRLYLQLNYSDPLCLNDPPSTYFKGEEFRNSKRGNKHAEHRVGNQYTSPRMQLLKENGIDQLPPHLTIKWINNKRRECLAVVKRGTSFGLPRGYRLGRLPPKPTQFYPIDLNQISI